MQNVAFDLDSFLSSANETRRSDVINLYGKSINECLNIYILSNQVRSKAMKQNVSLVMRTLDELNPSMPTYRFDLDFNEGLFHYLVEEKGVKPSTAGQYLHTLVSVLRWAGRHGAEVTDTFESVPRVPYEPYRISLTLEEVAAMYDKDINTLPYKKQKKQTCELVRDQFVMNCIGYGLRYSDLHRVDNSCFNGDTLTMLQKKTGRPVTNKCDMILFESMFRDLNRKYPNHEMPYRNNLTNYNRHLKDFCKCLHGTFDNLEVISYKVGDEMYEETRPRWSMISSHVARRTFITNNILVFHHSVTEVQHAVGHKQSSTTDGYVVIR